MQPLPHRATLAVLGLAWLLALPIAAQKLPEGAPQPDRERTFDLLHLAAELHFDLPARSVSAKATLRLAPLRPLAALKLDARELRVESVTLGDSRDELDFTTGDGSLAVRLPREIGAGEEIELRITWFATPAAGMYFQPDRDRAGRWFVHTYGEGGLHANWLPLYNGVDDKFTSEMRLTVPAGHAAVSNGRLVERREHADGRSTWHWSQEKPHPNYLISVYVGDFERGELPAASGGTPLAYWVPRGRLEEGAWAFRNTPRMVDYFSRRFGVAYPWVKYDQVAVPDYAIGAMEHTGVTGHRATVLRLPGEAPLDFGGPTLDEYWTDWSAEATISHELAHHWFGNLVTCRNLAHLWLNESLASYLMMLWDEESVGRDQLLFDVELARRHYLAYVGEEHLIRPLEYSFFDSPNDIYNEEHTYLKGAAFFHLLRAVLGDEAFFGGLGEYLRRHAFGNVESRDLARALEEAAGGDLGWLFDDWVTGGGHPVLEVSWRWLPDRQAVDLAVDQVQPLVEGQGLFRLPVTVTLAADGRSWQEKVWIEEESHHFLLAAPEEPRMVSFDGAGDLIAELRFPKEVEELVYQAAHDELPGRLRALGQLARRFPTRPETLEALEAALDPRGFWALQAEAAQLLGEVRTPAAEELLDRALASPDYRVRKAAALALPRFGTPTAAGTLRRLISEDPHSDVVATAIVALARAEPGTGLDLFRQQLGRDAWHDEIRIAALRALTGIDTPEVETLARPYVGASFNQDVRQAAFEAWEAADPADPDLHRALLAAAQEPPYALQQFALEALGRLYVGEALPLLDALVERQVDPNLTQLAGEAAEEIRRVRGER